MSDTLVLNADGTPLSYVPLSVIGWQRALQLLFNNKVHVIKEYEDWEIHSQYLSIKVPSIVINTEHVKWARRIKYNRTNVYLRDDLQCQLRITSNCKDLGGKVNFDELTIDHVIPRSHGGRTTWQNVCTCCKACNAKKGNNFRIIPAKIPAVPNYYALLNKRKALPLTIREEEWKTYIDWPDEMIRINKQKINRKLANE